jgi:hypothetical protein
MRVTRVLDVLVLLLLAALVVMPRPSVTVKAALHLSPERRDLAAELQAHLLGAPGDVGAAVDLAKIFLDGHRPDWALATVTPLVAAHDSDYRLHLLRAIAYADRFEAAPAYEAATRALATCDAVPATCGDAPHARITLLKTTLERIRGIDMRTSPALAKDKIFEGLHPTWLSKGRRAGGGAAAGAGAGGRPAPARP